MSQTDTRRSRAVEAFSAVRERSRAGLTLGLDLLFPPCCTVCRKLLSEGDAGAMICPDCRRQIIDQNPTCLKCGENVPPATGPLTACPHCAGRVLRFETVVRLGRYEDLLRSAVLRIKRGSQQPLAIALGKLLAEVRGPDLRDLKLDVVVPIPMHWTRRMWRGFNSPEIIADRLHRRLGIPVAAHLLRRRRRTRQQANLSPQMRFKNVRKSFRAARDKDLKGARVLLVDDILTTGATCSAAARALRDAGASYVAVAVLARAEGTV